MDVGWISTYAWVRVMGSLLSGRKGGEMDEDGAGGG